MSKLSPIVWHTVRDQMLSYRAPIAAVVMVVLFGLSFASLIGDYNAALEDHATVVQSNNPMLAYERPSALAIFSAGLFQRLTMPYKLNTFSQIEAGQDQRSLNRFFILFDTPDSLYIFRVILTLLAIFLMFDVITGERERGTLPICLANALSRRTMIFGKMLGGFISLAVPCSLVFLAGIGIASVQPTVALTGADVARLLLFLATSLLLVAVFVALAGMVSAISSSSARSLMVLIGAWAVLTYFVPTFASSVAQAAARVPEGREMNRKLLGIWTGGLFDLHSLSPDHNYTRMDREDALASILAKSVAVESHYFAISKKQSDIFHGLSRLSPVSTYVTAATELMGNSINDLRDFKMALRQERNVQAQSEETGTSTYHYRGRPVLSSLTAAVPELALMAVWLAVFSSGAVLAFNRAAVK